MNQQNMVNTMQSEGNNECIYISDESPSVPQISALSKSPFAVSDVSSNLGVSLVDEIEMEDIPDDIIVPVTPSPLLNNKRQQHITIGRGIKRTCLEKAFSTMSTSSSNCNNSVDAMDYHFPKQGGRFAESNSKSINGKECNIAFSVTGISKNDVPSKEKEMSFPHKFISRNGVFNSARNGILKPENCLGDVQILGKPKAFMPRKRSTVVINSDSDDSTDNMAETSYRNILHPIQSNYELRSSKEPTNENKLFQKSKTVAEHCYNKPSSEKLLENYGLIKTKKFTSKCSNNTQKVDSSNRGKSHICKESKFQPTGLHQDDAFSEPSVNRSFKNQIRISKRNPKAMCKDHYHEQEARCSTSATLSYNNIKSAYSMNNGQNSDGVANQRNCHSSRVQINVTASTSSKSENVKARRKHSHRGQIARFPVEDSDTDVEFYDAKSDLSDLADSKRPTRASQRKKSQRRQKHIMECLSSDSSSDVSVVSEMHISPFNDRTSKQHTRNTESPDPVEQVRQMEEDERLAYMLQAQFDAELECNDSNEEICGDFNSSFLSSLSVDSASSSSESSSSSSFSTAAAEVLFPYLVSNSLSQRTLRDINSSAVEQARRSTRIQRQQSIMGWMPESVRTVLTAWMPNFTEDNTYESLLEISEQIGEESRGLKKQQINSLPTRKFSTIHMLSSSASRSGSQECQDCTICLCEYQNNDLLRSLPCCHEFHANCIDRWLKSHSTCPICRIEVSLRRPFGRKRKS